MLTQDEGAFTQKVTEYFSCAVKWQIKYVIFQPHDRRDVKVKLVLPKNKHKNANLVTIQKFICIIASVNSEALKLAEAATGGVQ